MNPITGDTQWLTEALKHDEAQDLPTNVEKIKLNQLVSKLGFVYEKLRNAVDYNDEHLVRRNALERFLRRHLLFLHDQSAARISQALIYDFIRARYLPNDTLPETIISTVAITIDKYLQIIAYIDQHQSTIHQPDKVKAWVVALASCEIDEYLIPVTKHLAITNFMYSRMIETINIVGIKIDDQEKNLQIYIATLRTLLKADTDFLRYRLLTLYIPSWPTAGELEIKDFCDRILAIRARIDAHLFHPVSFQMIRGLRRQAVFFTLLRELIEKSDNTDHLLNTEETLTEHLTKLCSTSYKKIKKTLVGSTIRVIIYILLTKTILAVAIELPYDRIFLGQIHWTALLINVIFHPILMLIVAMTISVPGRANTAIIIDEIKKIITGAERKVVIKIKDSLKPGSISYLVFNTIYLIMFAISFGIVIRILMWLDFNIMSGALFIFFLTLVSFFGFRLRNLAKQLSVVPRKDNLTNFIVDFFSLPIISVGRFVSNNFAKVNIFLYILDFVIETPFKMLVEFLDKAVSFVKEKREEIVE